MKWLEAIKFDKANKTASGPGYYGLPVYKGEGQFISYWKVPI